MNQINVHSPETIDEMLSWVNGRLRNNHPFLIKGNNTRFPQCDHSQANGDILSTKSIKDLLFFDPDDMVVGAQAGMPIVNLQASLNEKDMFLPINPWYPQSTVGSVFACNDYGPNRMNAGGIRDSTIGIEYINGKGELVKAGGKVVKNVTGYDLGKMMLGSLGGLGVITSINFKVIPNLIEPYVLYSHYDSEEWIKKVKQLHEKMIPIEWIQVIYTNEGWELGIGFSGNEARRSRILKDLLMIFPEYSEVLKDNLYSKKDHIYPGMNRFTGFMSTILNQLPMSPDYLHVRCMVPTRGMLTQTYWNELKDRTASLVIHPIGGDYHVIVNENDLNEQQKVIEILKEQLGKNSGKMSLIRSNVSLTEENLGDFALPNAYSLVKRLKKQLDPSSLFISPFYNH